MGFSCKFAAYFQYLFSRTLLGECFCFDFRDNVIVVQFFYQEMKEENVVQEPSYDFYKLVGR